MELSIDEKINIINQRKRNLEYAKYGIEMSIIEENAVSDKNQEIINSLNSQISDINKKISALDAEIKSLS